MRVGPLRPNGGGGGAAFAHRPLWSSPAAWCGWRGSSLCTTAPHSKSWDVTRKELSIWDHKGIFLPWEIPLAAPLQPCPLLFPSSQLLAGREVGKGRASRPVRAHGASVWAAAGCCGAPVMLCEVPGWCHGGCTAGQVPCQIQALSFGLSFPAL